MLGAVHERRGVHFLRNIFSVMSKEAGQMVAATIPTICAQLTADAIRAQSIRSPACSAHSSRKSRRCCWQQRTT
ncbi:hypothetical protein [Kitasatospora xanthocidica]|uniref:hypothetical protein n=1 Tax=Kitasatospora xanthocidica TaxID=83382 RepID=UPI00227D81D2|nr:hypothetical protein [Kitasatospora xanthocidica]